MRKLLAAATALGLLTGSLTAMAADSSAGKPVGSAVIKPQLGKIKHHAKGVHRQHFVPHHRHHRMALSRAHRKFTVLHKKHQVRKTAKPVARNG
jgi:hypothetical protein